MFVKSQITFEDFGKLDLRVGEVREVGEVKGSNKLLKLTVDFGEELGTRTIYAGIKRWYGGQDLLGRKFIFVVNLRPKTFRIGEEDYTSEGMVLAGSIDSEAVLYAFDKDIPPGSRVT